MMTAATLAGCLVRMVMVLCLCVMGMKLRLLICLFVTVMNTSFVI